jgi:hypothetical protein
MGDRSMERLFYYSKQWRAVRESVPGPPDRLRVRWWDEEEEDSAPAPDVEADPIVEAELAPSPRTWLDALVETFVAGRSRNRLIRKEGYGMDPPFKRMDGGISPVVEMRTVDTRTFGFFVQCRVFVGHRLALKSDLLKNPALYEQYKQDVLKLYGRMESTERDGHSLVEDLIGD